MGRTGKRILIVDDDDAIRALLQTVLRRRGYQVETARNGAEAIERMASCRYALLVLDLMMPIMNGWDVLDHVGALTLAQRPLVLVLTAGIEPRRFDSELVVGLIQKPFDIELLVDTVSGCITATDEAPENDCPEPLKTGVADVDKAN
ncbi:MAG TPA: response regulator [Thermoanaerobaculia bacterium]|nr:response regulator [Thermoanaerobaculia bacterium]